MDAQPRGDFGMNAVLAAWHHHRIQQEMAVHAAIRVQGNIHVGRPNVVADTRFEPGTGSLSLEGQQPRVDDGSVAPPEILIPAGILNLGDKVTEGQLIAAVALPWFEILEELGRDPQFLYQLDWRKMEELMSLAE